MTRSTPALAIAAAALGFSVPAAASAAERPAAAPVAAPTDTAQPARETRYCVSETSTGSRIEKRVCHTRAEWLKEGFDPLAK